jgi:hypothetical protein
MRHFDIEVTNKADKFGKGTTKTLQMTDCKAESLRELVLKIAEECHETEDDAFVSLIITQSKKE